MDFAATVRRGPATSRIARRTLVVHLNRPAESTSVAGIPPRAGLVVSRAVGPAVVRNRVKRRLRHLLCERMSVLPEGSTLVVRALPAAATASSQLLSVDLDSALVSAQRGRRSGNGSVTETTPATVVPASGRP